jgi:hypothetical protein
MQTAERRRTIRAIALSAAAHGAVLTVLAFHAPVLRAPVELAGPPAAIIPILIMPRLPPAAAGSAGGRPVIRLHRRQVRPRDVPPEVAPLITSAAAQAASTPLPATAPVRETEPVEPAPSVDLAAVLRRSGIGCANASAVALSRAEQELCQQQLGRGAGAAPFIPGPMSPARRAELEAAGARKDAVIRAREAPLANAGRPPQAEPQDYSGEPYITGSGQSVIGAAAHPSSKRAARKLQQLPP